MKNEILYICKKCGYIGKDFSNKKIKDKCNTILKSCPCCNETECLLQQDNYIIESQDIIKLMKLSILKIIENKYKIKIDNQNYIHFKFNHDNIVYYHDMYNVGKIYYIINNKTIYIHKNGLLLKNQLEEYEYNHTYDDTNEVLINNINTNLIDTSLSKKDNKFLIKLVKIVNNNNNIIDWKKTCFNIISILEKLNIIIQIGNKSNVSYFKKLEDCSLIKEKKKLQIQYLNYKNELQKLEKRKTEIKKYIQNIKQKKIELKNEIIQSQKEYSFLLINNKKQLDLLFYKSNFDTNKIFDNSLSLQYIIMQNNNNEILAILSYNIIDKRKYSYLIFYNLINFNNYNDIDYNLLSYFSNKYKHIYSSLKITSYLDKKYNKYINKLFNEVASITFGNNKIN